MRGFQFKLDKVLKVRQIEEEQVETMLIKERKKLSEMEEKVSLLEEKQLQLYQYLRSQPALELDETLIYRNFIQRNRKNIEAKKKKVAVQQSKVAQVQADYLQKRKKREALEKLKEKEYKLYQKNVLLKEQKELDELAQRVSV